MASGDTKTESYLRAAAEGTRADLPSDTCCNTKTQNLILGVANRIMDVEDEVEELKNNPDVVDIVETYQDLQNYDTSTLTDKDIIRVLEDSTRSNSSTYYRWNATTNQFDYIGEAGGGGPTVVQTAGTSTTDVMSQNATTSMVFDDPAAQANIKIGDRSSVTSPNGCVTIGERASGGRDAVIIGSQTTGSVAGCVAIGHSAYGTSNSVAIGYSASSGNRTESVAIGHSASTGGAHPGSVALGAYATCARAGEVYIGSSNTSYGYNSTNYRVLGGVHDPVDAHDAATKGYVDANVSAATFYMSGTPYADRSGVSLYSDIALTTAVPASTFVQALRDCKSVFLVYKSGDLDWSERRIAQIIGSHIPNADTAEAYDEVFPAGYYFDGSAGDVYMIQSATSDPDDTASFKIARRT